MQQEFRHCLVEDIMAPIRNAIVGGPFGSDLVSKDYVAAGVPVIRGQNMGPGRWVGGSFAFVSQEKADRLSANCARFGDIVFTQRGTLGQVALVPRGAYDRYLISQSQMKLTPDSHQVDAAYLYYFFSSPIQQAYIHSSAIRTGVPHTNLSHLKKTPLLLPSLNDQRAIVELLGSIDDKIDANECANETLAAMAFAFFKSWFVDFDPVRAKSEGRMPAGIDAETSRMFPSAFDDSERGEIPNGWKLRTLGDCVALQRGTTYKSALLGLDGPRLLGLGSIRRDGGFRADSLKTYGGESPQKLLVRPGDLYVSLKDVTQSGDLLGSVARLPKWVELGRLTQDTVKLVFHGSPMPVEYIYWLLLAPQYREHCRSRAMGTTNLSLSREDFLAYTFAAPPSSILGRLLPIIENMSERMEQLEAESRTLAELRDTLLPKLISGEIRIKDAALRASEML